MNLLTLWPQGLKEWLITKTSEDTRKLRYHFQYCKLYSSFEKTIFETGFQFSLFSNYLPVDMACHTVISTQGTIWLETFTLAFSSATWRKQFQTSNSLLKYEDVAVAFFSIGETVSKNSSFVCKTGSALKASCNARKTALYCF